MKTYNVIINGAHEFTIESNNAIEAKKIASMNKRRMGIKGITKVRRSN